MPSQTDYVLDLPDADLAKLTDMLALPPQCGTAHPTRAWLTSQIRAIASLPKTVLRPSKLLPRLAVKLTESCAAPRLPPAAVLCATHKALHPWLVRALFNLLAAEVTMRCDRLRGNDAKPGDGVGRVLGILRSVNALWLEEGHFRLLFGEQAGLYGEKLRRVEGGCEACVLAAVGARGEVLAALRANLLGRTRAGEPRLLRVVESWMKWFGVVEGEALLRESEGMARGVRRARRAVRRGTHERRGREEGFERTGQGSFGGGSARSGREGGSKRASGSERVPETPLTPRGERISAESPRLDGGGEEPVREEEIAEWYARSEMEAGARVPARSVHPAFQPLSTCHEDTEQPEGSVAGGYTSILDCYGNNASGGKSSIGRKTSVEKTSNGRRTSWATCTVHTSQAPGHNPPPPDVPIPFLAGLHERESVEVPIYACSSIYSGTASPTQPAVRELASMGAPDPATMFRNPFAVEDGGRLRREIEQVSPGTVPEGGWI